MLVDPEILRKFADQTSSTANTIDANTLAGKVVDAFAGMSGSTCEWASRPVDEFAARLTHQLSVGFDGLAGASRGTAGTYEVTDDDLAMRFRKILPR